MEKEKIKKAIDTFDMRDEARIKQLTEATMMGQDIGPEVFLMVTEERLRDLTAVVGVIAKELICEVPENKEQENG